MKTTTSSTLLFVALALMLPPIVYFAWCLLGPESTVDDGQFLTFTIWSIAGLIVGSSISAWLAISRKSGRWLWLLLLSGGDAASLFVGLVGTTVARMH